MDPIPGPPGLPLLGNMLDLQSDEGSIKALEHLADIYGPIFQLTLKGRRRLFVSSAELMKELTDEKRFVKIAPPALSAASGPAGLFTARTEDPDWGQAHRILMPAFGPLAIEEMFDGMIDIASQLVLKWARKGQDVEIPLIDDYTRLTLDTIAACTMDYRFNSFYQETMHPFVAAMLETLQQAGIASRRPAWVNSIASSWSGSAAKLVENQQLMKKVTQDIIDHRRSHPTDKKDLLNTMLYGKDPKSGEAMRDELIAAEMLTFIIAGHETTSGLLSFATLYLLQNPTTLTRAQEEVDRVVATSSIRSSHLRELKYLEAVFRETLRLSPTAPALSKAIHPDRKHEAVLLDGRYQIEPDDTITILLGKAQQDPDVFSEDAREFKPERLLEDNPKFLEYQKYWRPFGNGSRACIGRSFALQEAILALAIILQNFDLRLADPLYKMRIKQTLTIKPADLYIKASLRHGMSAVDLDHVLHSDRGSLQPKSGDESHSAGSYSSSSKSLNIMYGSNAGTCQSLAQRLAADASSKGYNMDVREMDAFVGRLSHGQPNIIITASYEGEPPDNALHFVQWLQTLHGDELKGVKFAVFGCGHKDWHSTFHRIPKLVNDLLGQSGAERIANIGVSDVSEGNVVADFETWLDETLWTALNKSIPEGQVNEANEVHVEAEISTQERSALLRQDVRVGTVKDVRTLTAPKEPLKKHIEIELPTGLTYECGDYLAILPQNPEANVKRIMARFKLPWDATIKLQSKTFAPLPLNTSLSITDLLINYYELSQPATKRSLTLCANYAEGDDACRLWIDRQLKDSNSFQAEITEKRTSVFDIMTKFPQIRMSFPVFLSTLLPLSIRQYSISSSPLTNPSTCTITFSVLSAPSRNSIDGEGFHGVATTYLSSLKAGDQIQVATRKTAKQAFRLPLDVENTPLIMFCAGTGLAPFRGFVQQRVTQLKAQPGCKLAPALLYIGCRSSTRDRLYAAEMDAWADKGAVEIRYAFSKESEQSDGCKYVSDRMLSDADTIMDLWRKKARVYVCGSRAFGESVKTATESLSSQVWEAMKAEGHTEDEIVHRKEAFFASIKARAASDIFD